MEKNFENSLDTVENVIKKDNVEENLGKILDALVDVITKDSIPSNFDEMVENLKNTYVCKNAENASTCLFFKIEMFEDVLVKKIMPSYNHVKTENVWKLEYLWKNYNQVEHYISSFIEQIEGICCSVDKGRWLLNSYMRYLIDGTTPNMEKKKEQYHKPSFGTFEEWYQFIDDYIKSRYQFVPELIKSSVTLLNAARKNSSSEEKNR